MYSVPQTPGETQDPPGDQDLLGSISGGGCFTSDRGDRVPGVGLGRTGHVTAQPECEGARRAGPKVSVTSAPVAGQRHVWLGQNSAVSVPEAETRVHTGSGPAAGTHGCVVTHCRCHGCSGLLFAGG